MSRSFLAALFSRNFNHPTSFARPSSVCAAEHRNRLIEHLAVLIERGRLTLVPHAQTLQELGRLRSREGSAILAAAIIDDVMGVMVLSMVLGFSGGGGDPLIPIGKMVLFIPLAFAEGKVIHYCCFKLLAQNMPAHFRGVVAY